MLGLRASTLFSSRRQRTKSSTSTTTPLFLLGSNPPCRVDFSPVSLPGCCSQDLACLFPKPGDEWGWWVGPRNKTRSCNHDPPSSPFLYMRHGNVCTWCVSLSLLFSSSRGPGVRRQREAGVDSAVCFNAKRNAARRSEKILSVGRNIASPTWTPRRPLSASKAGIPVLSTQATPSTKG